MFTFRSIKLRTFDVEAIKHLYNFRYLTKEQFGRLKYPNENRESKDLTYESRRLNKLVKDKLLESDLLSTEGNTKIFYLTPTGIEAAKEILEIEEEQRGDGFFTYGEFDYELSKPPAKILREHHNLISNIFIDTFEFSVQRNIEIKWRDNRYAAVSWREDDKDFKYRPDGELLFKDRIISIEADRATESGHNIKDKFLGFFRYFNYLKKSGQSEKIPIAVLFVISSDLTRFQGKKRMNTIKSRWLEVMGEYANSIDLYMTELKDYRTFLYEYYIQDQLTKKIAEQVRGVSFYVMPDNADFPYPNALLGYDNGTIVWLTNRPANDGSPRYDNVLEWVRKVGVQFEHFRDTRRFVPIFWTTQEEAPNTDDLSFAFIYQVDPELSSLSSGLWHYYKNGELVSSFNEAPWNNWSQFEIPNNVFGN